MVPLPVPGSKDAAGKDASADSLPRGSWVHRPCGKVVRGRRTEHCTVCHESFAGSINGTTGDLHRVGDHHTGRRCLTPDEMIEKGKLRFDERRGCWVRAQSRAARFEKAAA